MSSVDLAIEHLDEALQRTFDLHRADDERAWLDPRHDRTYLRVQRPVRLAHHFDLAPAFLIRDSLLGTLGLVERIPDGASDVAAVVRRHVDTAIYARHLLLRDHARGSKAALTVELLLIIPPDDTLSEAVGAALRDLQRKTESLFHLGIGLLVHDADGGIRSGLRRAFPWLMAATQRWLASPNSGPGSTDAAARLRRLQRVSLSDYRLPGTRHLELAHSRVHLLHGPNGSGKSSLVEALEIVTNGKVQRIAQAQFQGEEDSYDAVIRHRGSTRAASVELTWNDGRQECREVGVKGIVDPLADVPASSFRLDQPLMERLVSRAPYERARHFLEAFFPEAGPALADYQEATRALDDALAALRPYVEDFKDGKRALESVQGWRGGGGTTATDTLPSLLNRWLERSTLADLAQRAQQVHASLHAARAAHWTPQHETLTGLLAASIDLQTVSAQAVRWAREAEELWSQLASFRPTSRSEQERLGVAATLTPQQCIVLNRVGRWLVESDMAAVGLGDKIARVMAGSELPTFGTIVIGSDGWAAPLLTMLDGILAACDTLASEKPAAAWPGVTTCGEFEVARVRHDATLETGAVVNARFLDKMKASTDQTTEFDGSLIAAINELMALFTPARWGYDDLDLPSTLQKGGLGMAINVGKSDAVARAELRLNTAELNMFTVVVFLLCAGRVPKPLGLLVFDDPLQNMDELTATALARGLAKLVRLWDHLDRREELMLLFHGFGDLTRFQDEMASATYRLPWLSPGRGPANITIAAEQTTRIDPALQTLDTLVSLP